MKWTLTIGLALAITFAAALSARAHPLDCVPRAVAASALAAVGKTQVAAGVTRNGNLAELWLDPETGAWTIFFTTTDGIACAVMTGGAWQEAPEPEKGDGM